MTISTGNMKRCGAILILGLEHIGTTLFDQILNKLQMTVLAG
eukprot:CAMPEP_0172458540 /NCGR_PEP_ID=MMETSP1065-20121228/28079_1 /TAXON_ID=265537 /ORGANISM="Amphiprora paludosa, Strain CCMP125" /LENGTH=41 /DNA_ID= /DNA_START= /DNA_END= /DNA_ORIENTATION=